MKQHGNSFMIIAKELRNTIAKKDDYVLVKLTGELNHQQNKNLNNTDGINPLTQDCVITPEHIAYSKRSQIRLINRVLEIGFGTDVFVEIAGNDFSNENRIKLAESTTLPCELYLVPTELFDMKQDVNAYDPSNDTNAFPMSKFPNSLTLLDTIPMYEGVKIVMGEDDWLEYCKWRGFKTDPDSEITSDMGTIDEDGLQVSHLYPNARIDRTKMHYDKVGNILYDTCEMNCKYVLNNKGCKGCKLYADLSQSNLIAVDIYTITENASNLLNEVAKFIPNAVETLKRLVDGGYRITLTGCADYATVEDTQKALETHNIETTIMQSDIATEIYSGITTRKVYANYYVEKNGYETINWKYIYRSITKKQTWMDKLSNWLKEW